MKTLFIFLLPFLFAGCSSSKKTTEIDKLLVKSATFKPWSNTPAASSDIPEKGADLSITIKNWPKESVPEYIVYKKRKSLTATIADRTDSTVTITGRIIRASGMMAETSKSADVSDRLVFTNSEGKNSFVEIESWQSLQE